MRLLTRFRTKVHVFALFKGTLGPENTVVNLNRSKKHFPVFLLLALPTVRTPHRTFHIILGGDKQTRSSESRSGHVKDLSSAFFLNGLRRVPNAKFQGKH
jgi:hypothetical protein